MVATTLITIKLQNVEGNGKTIALIFQEHYVQKSNGYKYK